MAERVTIFLVLLMAVAGCSQDPPNQPDFDPRPTKVASTPTPGEQPASTEPTPIKPQKPSADTSSSASAASSTVQDEIAAVVQAMGGEVMRNNTEGNPIYGVRVAGRKPDVAALVAAIKPLDQLEELSLDRAELADSDLTTLGTLTGIKNLDISGNAITDAGLAHLKPLTNLEALRLSQNQISDAGLLPLTEFKKLKKLFLGRNPITDDGLVHLKDLPNLEELNLSGCTDVTDAALPHLAKIPNLKELWIPFTRVKDQGVATIQRQRSNVKVER